MKDYENEAIKIILSAIYNSNIISSEHLIKTLKQNGYKIKKINK